MAPYTNPSEYLKFNSGTKSSESDPCCGETEQCSCCPIGTIAVYNPSTGEHAGCLTPNDAQLYLNSVHIPSEGYVKVYHPTTGEYLGDLPSASAIEMLQFLSTGSTALLSDNTFNILTPVASSTGFVELTYTLAAGVSSAFDLVIDRIGLTDAVLVNIVNSNEGVTFNPSGTATSIAVGLSETSVQIKWSGIILAAGTYTFILSFQTSYETKQVPFRLTLS